MHGIWVVATQNCDLSVADAGGSDGVVELRPVFREHPPADWGIRSRKLRLNDEMYVESGRPSLHVSPAFLAKLPDADRMPPIDDARATALKTWLGKRYDRPAVPDNLVALAQAIAKYPDRPARRGGGLAVHDVLLQVREEESPPHYYLFAVITDDADANAAREWLAKIGAAVPAQLGVLRGVDVGTRAQTSLQLLEEAYAADMSQITWGTGEPRGAI